MSLDNLVAKTISSRCIKEVTLFLPPEYEIDHETWRELIQSFNHTTRPAKLAAMIEKYIRELKNIDRRDYSGIISVSEIVEKDGRFVTNLTFEGDKAGLAALFIYTAEDLQLALISEPHGVGGIKNVVLTYIPD